MRLYYGVIQYFKKLLLCEIVQLLWKAVWSFLKELNIELLCNSAIPHLGLHPQELQAGTPTGICTHLFIVALFTIAPTWEQLKCPLEDKWKNKMRHLQTKECSQP